MRVSGGDQDKGRRKSTNSMEDGHHENSLIAFSLVILLSSAPRPSQTHLLRRHSHRRATATATPADTPTPSVVPLIGAGTGVVAELP